MRSDHKLYAILALAAALAIACVAFSVDWYYRSNAVAVQACINRVPVDQVKICHDAVWGH